MGLHLNPSIVIRSDPELTLSLARSGEFSTAPIDIGVLNALYRLQARSALGALEPQSMVESELFAQLIDVGILVAGDDEAPTTEGTDPNGFAISEAPELASRLASASTQQVRAVTVIDDAFPELARRAIDLWARTLPYRRLDLDREDTIDLHWICRLDPLIHVRGLPFLRAIDALVRRSGGVASPLRAHVYAGMPGDQYHVHRDSFEASTTVIYYPSPWQDAWGGQLIFQEVGEAAYSVSPATGRLVMFDGSIPHQIGSIRLGVDHPRYSIVIRYGRTVEPNSRMSRSASRLGAG